MRAILDDELLSEIEGMIYFQKWRNAINYKFSFLDVSATAGRDLSLALPWTTP